MQPKFYKIFALYCILYLFATTVQASTEHFPRPAALEPAVRFWTQIYANVDSNGGLIHDNLYLDVVYEHLVFPENQSPKERSKSIEERKKYYRRILLQLANNSENKLSAEERKVLALWPKDVNKNTLQQAADRIRFQLGQSDRYKAGLIRSGRWLPYITKVMQDMGLPTELALLPHVESSFNPEAYSSVGAAGMWQFTRSTGRRFMQVDHVIDERLDPFIATHAAAELLKYNYSATNSWPLALTAYNHGLGGMREAIKQTGGTDIAKIVASYQSKTFKFASRNFYVAFLASMDVHNAAQQYFGELQLDAAENNYRVELPAYIAADTLAEQLKIDLTTLQVLNPALRPAIWQGKKRIPPNYPLRLPHTIAAQTNDLIAKIPETLQYDKQITDTQYVVQRGDSLSTIAARFELRVSELMAMNNISSSHFIRAGQTLRLPTEKNIVVDEKMIAKDGFYTVRSGDTLSVIAKQFNINEQQLIAQNEIKEPNQLTVGAHLNIQPGKPPIQVASLNALPEDKINTEPVNATEAAAVAPAQPAGLHPALSADPNDYSVLEGDWIRIQAAETLGHFAEWLQVPTEQLRELNRLRHGQALMIGRQLRLDFSRVDKPTFEQRRLAYHQNLQQNYFSKYQISGSQEYTLRQGDSIWEITHKQSLPLWLLLQYNPDIDMNKLRPGMTINIPKVIAYLGAE